MENVKWNKCSEKLPNITKYAPSTFWGYFMNQSGETYIDLVGWNEGLGIFECGQDEIVLYWCEMVKPLPPDGLKTSC